ncbi:response regulator [Neobacillus mesonae]|nr:response regulator [Neobacillus mesonae]
MYKVLLADDDFPVLELLSEIVDWELLGFELCGTYENGLLAYEHAQKEPPDVLITDIGMPKMDGLTLSGHLRELNPSIRIAVLSCHTDFHYAQQAMKLSVQEYLVKDALDPEDLCELLIKFKNALDQELLTSSEQHKMRHLLEQTEDLRKQKFIRELIEQPLLPTSQWMNDAAAYRILKQSHSCLPVAAYIEDYTEVMNRFSSDEMLSFTVNNALREMVNESPLCITLASFNYRQSFLFISHKPDIRRSIQQDVEIELKRMQSAIYKVLNIQLAFIAGHAAADLFELKKSLKQLVEARQQRFFLPCGAVQTLDSNRREFDHLFSYYEQAKSDVQNAVVSRDVEQIKLSIGKWCSFIEDRYYPESVIKDWVIKLILDLKLNLNVMSYYTARGEHTADWLHLEISLLDSLWTLKKWLNLSVLALINREKGVVTSRRMEVLEACRYISLHLERRITLDEVGKHLHLNTSYFSRLFKKETGSTFIEYVTLQKMERAKELLAQTMLTVGEISERLGYDNQSYFIKTFKAHEELTPIEYRMAIDKVRNPEPQLKHIQ